MYKEKKSRKINLLKINMVDKALILRNFSLIIIKYF